MKERRASNVIRWTEFVSIFALSVALQRLKYCPPYITCVSPDTMHLLAHILKLETNKDQEPGARIQKPGAKGRHHTYILLVDNSNDNNVPGVKCSSSRTSIIKLYQKIIIVIDTHMYL